ncbi:MAG: ATP synthase F1 subunit epsilon [Pontiella sp.]
MPVFNLHITTPEGNAWDDDAESISAFAVEGSLTILANHAPMITALKPGVLKVRDSDQTQFFAAGEGVLEVRVDKQVVLLVDYAEPYSTEDEAKKHLEA